MSKIKYTFEDWCLDNDHQDYLDLWDYELNDCEPSEIPFKSNKKYYFKCQKGRHESELWKICRFADGYVHKIECRRCKSIGAYLIERDGNLACWEDNGIDPFLIRKYSSEKCYFICKDCGQSKLYRCSDYTTYGLGCSCGDGQSYPEKFTNHMFVQLGVEFEKQYRPKWCVIKVGNRNKQCRYDFYIPSKKLIIEIDGGLGHGKTTHKKSGITVEESQYIDDEKDRLAKENDLEIIRISADRSELDYMKKNLFDKLNRIFELDNIDWTKCGEFAEKNIVKEVCLKWDSLSSMSEITTSDLSKLFKLSTDSIRRYLKSGSKLGWCNYDPNAETEKNNIRYCKKVEVEKDGVILHVFGSVREASVKSIDMFGVKLLPSNIAQVCRKEKDSYKGFRFKYI